MTTTPTVRRVQEPSGDLTPKASGDAANIDPTKDKNELAAQGSKRPATIDPGLTTVPSNVYADDWWSHVHPVVELHGYFRTRGEMYHNFSLGRLDSVGTGLWPRPLDDSYASLANDGVSPAGRGQTVALCGALAQGACTDKTQAFANMRLRLNPELHISDNLRILSQIDALDNVVLGSTPASYYDGSTNKNANPGTAGYQNDTQNSPANSIRVKRVWAEYTTPVGQVRFGRMPTH